MASFSDKVKVLIDVDSTGATSGLTNFKKSFSEAEGAVGKFKVAGGAAMDFIKNNAANMAMAAGAAITTFAIKAIGDFQDLALEVDKFRNATGLSTDASSRWIEVAGDLGVESDTVRNAINKMNREIAGNRDEFNKLGIEIARTNDGAVDVNATFLNTIDRIKRIADPAERARVATKLLGKSWQEVSEIISMGAGQVAAALRDVGDEKIIDDNEIQKAKDLRAAQDALRDAFEKISITLGNTLIPVLTKVIDATAGFVDEVSGSTQSGGALERFGHMLSGFLPDSGGILKTTMEALTGSYIDTTEAVDDSTVAFFNNQTRMYQLRFEALKTTEQVSGLTEAWDIFLGRLSAEEAWDGLQGKIDAYNTAVMTAFKENTPAAWEAADDARRNAQEGVGLYIKQLGNVPGDIQTRLLTLVDAGKFEEAMRLLDMISRPRTVGLVPILPGDTPSEVRGRRALGGPVSANVPYLVGERGPEVFIPSGSGRISPGMGGTIVVNVAGSVVTEQQLVESIRVGLIQAQRSGKQLVYSNQ